MAPAKEVKKLNRKLQDAGFIFKRMGHGSHRVWTKNNFPVVIAMNFRKADVIFKRTVRLYEIEKQRREKESNKSDKSYNISDKKSVLFT